MVLNLFCFQVAKLVGRILQSQRFKVPISFNSFLKAKVNYSFYLFEMSVLFLWEKIFKRYKGFDKF